MCHVTLCSSTQDEVHSVLQVITEILIKTSALSLQSVENCLSFLHLSFFFQSCSVSSSLSCSSFPFLRQSDQRLAGYFVSRSISPFSQPWPPISIFTFHLLFVVTRSTPLEEGCCASTDEHQKLSSVVYSSIDAECLHLSTD